MTAPVGCRHEAGIFGSPTAMLETVVPFLDEAAEAGVPAIVRLEPDLETAVRRRVRRPEAADFVAGGDTANPVRALREMHEAAQRHVSAGARQVRVVGCVPRASQHSSWEWEQWARMEGAVNRMYAALPLWTICCFLQPPEAIHADIGATHTALIRSGGRRASEEYVEPEAFLGGRPRLAVEILDRTPPAFAMIDPHPGLAREAVRRLTERAGFDPEQAEELVLAVNEILSNGFRHGRGPVALRGWVQDGDVLVTVGDGGSGIADQFAGMLAPEKDQIPTGGNGIWLARICTDLLGFEHGVDGFTVRLAARAR